MAKRFTPEFKEQIIALYKTGISMHQVSDQLGISQSSVSRTIRETGYDRYHVGSTIAKSIPDLPAAKPTKNAFTVLSRAMKLRGDATLFTYEISTESDIVHIEADSVIMDIKLDAIDSFITELQNIKTMLGSPS